MKYILIAIVILMVLILGIVRFWAVIVRPSQEYNASLVPELLFTLPASECEHLTFGVDGDHWSVGPAVYELLEERGIVVTVAVFAVRGERAIRFVPDMAHTFDNRGLERVPAEEGTVYFYTYDSRFAYIIVAP
jgi:hypothetical protein